MPGKPSFVGVKKRTEPPKVEAVERLFEKVPDADIREVISALAEDDPVTWTMVKRRLRHRPLVFDIAKKLEELDAEYAAKDPTTITTQDVKAYKEQLLRHRPFLLQPLGDLHPHKVYKKGRQVGVSELSITEVFWFLDTHPGTKWVYTFPRDKQLLDFSNTRIKEALDETPAMRALLNSTNQVTAKGISRSHLLLRSTWEANLGEGIDADGVTLDEKDRMKDGVDVAFQESLSSSKHGLFRELSTPILPGRGIDASFIKSDQNYWHVRCKKCGLEQTIDFPENFVQRKDIPLGATELEPGTWEYGCRLQKCRGELDRYHGRWIPKYPNKKSIRSYHIPQTIAPWITATEIMQKKLKYKFLQLWENYVLGATSRGESILVSEQDFKATTNNYGPVLQRTKDWSHISVGIDWGATSWVVVLGKNAHNGRNYLLNAIMIEDDPLHELASVNNLVPQLRAYEPDIIIADAGYGKDRNAKLNRLFEHKFYACFYNPASKGSRSFTPNWSPALSKVLVDRTMTIRVTCNAIKERQIGFMSEENLALMALVQKHFLSLAPIKEEEDGEIWEDIKNTGPDHLAHSTVYAYLGLDHLTHTNAFNFGFM